MGVIILQDTNPADVCLGTINALVYNIDTGVVGVVVSSATVDVYIPGTERKFVDNAGVSVLLGGTQVSYTLNLPSIPSITEPGMYELKFDIVLSNGETKCAPFRLKISDFQ